MGLQYNLLVNCHRISGLGSPKEVKDDINTPGSNISCHKDISPLSLEFVQDCLIIRI